MKKTIVFFDTSPEDHREIKKYFASHSELEVITVPDSLDETTVKQAERAQIISVFIPSQVTAPMMSKMPDLKMIAARSTGFDNIDLASAAKHHICVCNVPTYGENTVAEYTFMLILALMRKLFAATDNLKSGQIDHTKLTGQDLHDKVLGVIGTGKIGRHVIKIANGFEIRVIAYDPYPNAELRRELFFDYVELDQLLTQADITTLHAPYTKDNHHLIDAAALAKTKPGALVINTARGELVDTKALVDNLISGHLGGAGLDVVEGENLLDIEDEVSLLATHATKAYSLAVEHSVLEKLDNVVLTPHNAFNSSEALQRIRLTTFQNINAYLAKTPQNQVK